MNNDGLIVVAVDDEPPRWRNSRIFSTAPQASRKSGLLAPPPRRWSCCRPTTWTRCSWTSECPGWTGWRWPASSAVSPHRPGGFVTAYDSHAVDAFDIAAVDYLLKPIRAQRLAQAVVRVQRQLEAEVPDVQAPAEEAPADETIAVELGGVTRYVKRSDIVYVEAQRDYVRLHTRTAGHLVRVPLANLEERWAPAGFPACASPLPRQRRLRRGPAHGRRAADGGPGEEQSVPVSRRHTPAVKAALVESRRLERDT